MLTRTHRQADLQLVYDDLVRASLSIIPTCYGRLVYLTSLRDPNTGRYEHYLLEETYGVSLAQAGLEGIHIQSYRSWIAMNLEQKRADLYLYLVSLSSDKRQVLQTWLMTTPYRSLIPLHTQPVEREVFLSDMQILLGLLMNELGIDGPEGAA
ncbi:MAG: hypothetical protein IT169_02005 [Bryobacterales bacterium]|nr:hypothetical protein [Bryobacterales bacterium]